MGKIDAAAALMLLKELEELLAFPTVPGHVERSSKLALALARGAPNPSAASLALELMVEIDKKQLGRANRLDEVLGKLHAVLNGSLQGQQK